MYKATATDPITLYVIHKQQQRQQEQQQQLAIVQFYGISMTGKQLKATLHVMLLTSGSSKQGVTI